MAEPDNKGLMQQVRDNPELGAEQAKPQSDELSKQQLMQQFFENQRVEMELKQQELIVRQQELENQREDQNNQKEMGLESIAAQLEDSKLKQVYFLTKDRRKSYLIGGGVLALFAFLVIAMFTGNQSFAEKIMDMLTGAVGGFAVGYFAKNKNEDK